MGAGAKRIGLTLQQPGGSTNSEGGYNPGPHGTVGAVCARVRPLSGKELQIASAQKSTATVAVEMHAEYEVRPQWRFVFEDGLRVLNVVSVVDVEERGLDLLIMCEETVLEERVLIGE